MTAPRSGGASSVFDDLVLWALAAAGIVGATTWAGAQLATLAAHGRSLPAGPGEAVRAAVALPEHLGEPAAAWPPPARALVPGPVLYWVATALAAAVVVGVVVVVARVLAGPRPGAERRRRLGVDTAARLARPRDLAPLVVRGPTPGRLIVGRVGRRLVATETRAGAGRRGGRGRRGDRSAVAVIGPTRCGKTANVISGILDWEGPAILSSVRDDLLDATLARRRALGQVKVFDPTKVSGQASCTWSPLRDAASPSGAQKAARSLLAAYARPGARADVEFFSDLGTAFLSALFWVAAASGRTMADVVRWVQTRDRPTAKKRGDLGGLVDLALSSADPERRAAAAIAYHGLQAVWNNDQRTTSGIYVTAQRMLGIWTDPMVAAVSQSCDVNLEWLVSGPNTLYVCGPLNEQDRLAVLFGGILSDLIEQQAYEWAGRHRKPLPDLLVVLDEAANTPTRWLPNVASTCSGLGILLVTVWQSKAQIDAAYGTLADAVLTNHGTKVVFSGVSDLSTLEWASRLVGEEEVRHHAVSTDLARGGHSVNESTSRTRLLPTDVLRQAAPGHALLVHGTLPPAHLVARPYFRDRRLRALARHGERPTGRAAWRWRTGPRTGPDGGVSRMPRPWPPAWRRVKGGRSPARSGAQRRLAAALDAPASGVGMPERSGDDGPPVDQSGRGVGGDGGEGSAVDRGRTTGDDTATSGGRSVGAARRRHSAGEPAPQPGSSPLGGIRGAQPPANRRGATAQAVYEEMMRTAIRPRLRALGFRGSGSTFTWPVPGVIALLGFQKSQFSDRNVVRFTVNATVVTAEAWEKARQDDPRLPAKPAASTSYGKGVWQRRLGALMGRPTIDGGPWARRMTGDRLPTT